jgi:hypothetical protein
MLQTIFKTHSLFPQGCAIPHLPQEPSHLTHVTQVYDHGRVDLAVLVYWPVTYGLEQPGGLDHYRIQVKAGNRSWMDLTAPQGGNRYWQGHVEKVAPGTPLKFRYRPGAGVWKPMVPLTTLDRVYSTLYVPDLRYTWKNSPPRFDQGLVLVETTLEGLLAGYSKGVLAPRSREEMFQDAIVQQILKTDIPGRLSEWAIDWVMAPLASSMADRACLNYKFNYLTYDIADVDWQLGTTQDCMRLVDTFYEYGITLVPDLIFVHQVSQPFEGSVDQIRCPHSSQPLYVDREAYQFRDYGTWMFKLDDPEIRKQLIDKVIAFVSQYRLKLIRLDYLDGLILQYSQRPVNYGAVFLQELRTALKNCDPTLRILGETFEAHNHWVIQNCVDLFYTPGFCIVDELYRVPWRRYRPLFPDIRRFLPDLTYILQWPRSNALYAQLHDETCPDEHIASGRPQTPWAYGQNPAELVKRQGEALIQMGQIQQRDLLDYVRRMVRGAEALAMFSANLVYMFVPAVDALTLGSSQDADHWKVQWDGVSPEQLATWRQTGLNEAEIFFRHDQHRADMIALRQVFRRYTVVDPDSLRPLTQVQICHVDTENAVLGLWRSSTAAPASSTLVLFNFGDHCFPVDRLAYECPVPQGHVGVWEVLFDGDWVAPERRSGLPQPEALGYPPGTRIRSQRGDFFKTTSVLKLHFGPRSLLILRYHP